MNISRSLAERFATTLSDHDLDAFAALIHDDYVNHNRYVEPGKAGAVAVFAQFLDAFEDFRVEVDDVAVDGDTLVGRYTYRGRHTGTFMGFRQAATRSRCTRSTSGASATAGSPSTGTS